MKNVSKLIVAFVLVLLIFSSEAQGQYSSWTKFSHSGFIARRATTSTVLNGKVYVIGGGYDYGLLGDMQVYDPNKDSWGSLVAHGDFPPHYGHSALVIKGKIYAVGGVENAIDVAELIWVFDPPLRSSSPPRTVSVLVSDSPNVCR